MKFLNNLWHWLDANTGWASEIIGALIILMLSALAHYLWRRVHQRISAGLSKTETVWDDALWSALARPTPLAIWLLAGTFAAQYAFDSRLSVVAKAQPTVRVVGFVVLLGVFLSAFIRAAEQQFIAKATASTGEDRLDATTVAALARLLRVSVVLIMALIMLDTLGFSISGVLAFGGIGGLAVSFAAKDLLANFFGGLMLYWDRPFAVGDSIRSPDRDIEGSVEYIGWRQTRIRTQERRSLYVPNAIFTSVAVENISRMTHRRIRETIGLRYDDIERLPAIVAAIQSLLRDHVALSNDDSTIAHLVQFGDSALNIMINAHTVTTDWSEYHRVREQVLLQIHAIVQQHGAEIAFPTRTVHVVNDENDKHGLRSY